MSTQNNQRYDVELKQQVVREVIELGNRQCDVATSPPRHSRASPSFPAPRRHSQHHSVIPAKCINPYDCIVIALVFDS